MRPFVGTGRGDGWLDQIDMSDHAVRSRLPHELPETVAALSWLAIRRRSRDTTIAWQPMLGAALERGLVEPTDETARFVSFVMHSSVSRGVVEDDLLAASSSSTTACGANAHAMNLGWIRSR
jgi:hypothetical protein